VDFGGFLEGLTGFFKKAFRQCSMMSFTEQSKSMASFLISRMRSLSSLVVKGCLGIMPLYMYVREKSNVKFDIKNFP